jgi:hypothetical protein
LGARRASPAKEGVEEGKVIGAVLGLEAGRLIIAPALDSR